MSNKPSTVVPMLSSTKSSSRHWLSSIWRSSSSSHSPVRAVLWYLLFGLLHECSHLIAAWWLLPPAPGAESTPPLLPADAGWKVTALTLLQMALGRHCSVPVPGRGTLLIENDDDDDSGNGTTPHFSEAEDVVRHAGWTFSVLLALLLLFLSHLPQAQRRCSRGDGDGGTITAAAAGRACTSGERRWWQIDPMAVQAAVATALEALSTDLVGFVPAAATVGGTAGAAPSSAVLFFFCGNFGLILLNSQWSSSGWSCSAALDILETMVRVTMMRGAQTGGVVTFEGSGGISNRGGGDGSSAGDTLKAVRARVVNGKRTDLSKLIRRKVEKRSNFMPGESKRLIRGFYGHTRFATSSKATLGGTHPHMWSPRRRYRIYDFTAKPSCPYNTFGVENYITHNGDLDFYLVRGKTYDLTKVQEFLERATGHPMPAEVDSAAIAGLLDLIRSRGSFALSARYAICFCLPTSGMDGPEVGSKPLPTTSEYESVAGIFEKALEGMMSSQSGMGLSLEGIGSNPYSRQRLVAAVIPGLQRELCAYIEKASRLEGRSHSSMRKTIPFAAFIPFLSGGDGDDDEEKEGGGSLLSTFATSTVDAFFDNDLFHSTKIFLENAKGSFGLVAMSSLDASRQICIAARGQPMSVAFYPKKGIVCYGSEQAAVKSALNFETPYGDLNPDEDYGRMNETLRLDLDDLGGEICLLDWDVTSGMVPVSYPNRSLPVHTVMASLARVVLLQQIRITKDEKNLPKRMTLIEGNDFMKPIIDDTPDPVLDDIHDIPRVLQSIQDDWMDVGLNRMTAWNLSRCLSKRLQDRVDGKMIGVHAGSTDIILTGCEVSLWLAEQFASDLRKAFPKLFVKAVSSNKLLGLFGQEISIPAVGYPMSTKTHDIIDPIVIIVSHSGGTFAPLACSNLLQSFTRNIFVVASEWDTQVGKQLRSMPPSDDKAGILGSSRIFSTGVGVRPAEPCSVSVAATHQLLTNIFEYICMNIIGDAGFRAVTCAVVTERDLQVLEQCNQLNIGALEEIVGVDRYGERLGDIDRRTEEELRSAGKLWSDHILENARAYIMSFIYIVGTVTSGYPLISGIAIAAGLDDIVGAGGWAFYITRFFDSLIYFWLPQICITILRLVQRRNLRHRMVARTVVVADCPWVAQAGEAFLSKIFACSYSIAGISVLSGNPADHLVHRHTHRVVRGSLLICGRPDGRLDALTSLEATVCLSVNQASSIQSLGGTCESITIGHNPFKLPLSHRAIFLESHRPQFLCECVLGEIDAEEARSTQLTSVSVSRNRLRLLAKSPRRKVSKMKSFFLKFFGGSAPRTDGDDLNLSSCSRRSSVALLGSYVNLNNEAKRNTTKADTHEVTKVLNDMIKERTDADKLRAIFDEIDCDGNGRLDIEEFVRAYEKVQPKLSHRDIIKIFKDADIDGSGDISFEEFIQITQMPPTDIIDAIEAKNRDRRGLAQITPSTETYFGEKLRRSAPLNVSAFSLSKGQAFSQELYESRIASLQRFVSMTVMFHEMGQRVQSFFPRISFGYWGYRMDRTHSIMRIASTASPVSGADVRERMERIQLERKIRNSVLTISRAWLDYKKVAASSRSRKEEWMGEGEGGGGAEVGYAKRRQERN